MVQPPSWLLAQPLPVHVGPALMLVLIFIAQPPLKRLPHTEPQPPPPALMLVLIFIAQPPCCGQPPGQWPALTLVLIFMVVLSVEVSYDLETRRPSPGPKEPTRRRSRAPHDGRRATQPGRPALSPNRCRCWRPRIPRRRFGRSSSRCRRSSTRNHRTSRCSRRQGASAVLRRGWWLGARRRSPHRRPGRDSPVGSSDSRWANRRMPRTHARRRARERAGSVGACRRREQRACRRSARDRAMTLRAPQGRAAALGSGPRAEVCPADALPCPVPAPISWRSRARVRAPACPHRGRREATDLRSGESAVMVRSPLRYAPGLVDRSRLDARLDLHGSASVRQAGVHVARGARPDARLDLHHSASIEGLAVAAGAGLEGRLDLHRLSLR